MHVSLIPMRGDTPMKKKINKMLVLIAAIAILLTTLLITLVFYDLFRRQVLEDLKAYTLLVGENDDTMNLQRIGDELYAYGIRLTLIGNSGEVVFDNEADLGQMENHNTRPEIVQALESGEGQAVRRSETLSRDTFYYAVGLREGGVLRVAKDAGSIYSIFGMALPSLLIVLVLLILLCMLLAHYLTVKLVSPIEKLASDLNEYRDGTGYEELTPFISMIRRQHQDIMKNAQMRQEFTANVSHELKTPLTSISGYAELIETGMASESDVTRFAHGIHSSAKRLLTLINDIIRLSELDGAEEEVVFEQIDLYHLARTCVEMLEMNADKHQVSLSIKGEECFVRGNKQMLEELLYNLCDNAIRYNNAGGSVEVEVYSEGDRKKLVVRDTGIGIPQEHRERIFERFYRVDKSRSKSTGGTGLGLAIVKHIIARHEAEIELDSQIGEGTVITVSFNR